MTYQELSRENRYLYGKLEALTLLLGHAIVTGQAEQYLDCLRSKVELHKLINGNLDKIEEIWIAAARQKQYEVNKAIRKMRALDK